MKYFKITIKGIVQGVGFRPFLYNLANNLGLKGIIVNKGNIGVELLISLPNSKDDSDIQNFIDEIRHQKPSISYTEDIIYSEVDEKQIKKEFSLPLSVINSKLTILPSVRRVGEGLTLPPDIAICDKCLEEMNDPNLKRFYKYPFIACAQCGPRFTTVVELPYDRIRTTMKYFPYCKLDPSNPNVGSCEQEYKDFHNRRFHAQTFACRRCGPNYFLIINPIYIKRGEFNQIMLKITDNKNRKNNEDNNLIRASNLNLNLKNSSNTLSIPPYNYKNIMPEKLEEFLNSKELISSMADLSIRIAAEFVKRGYVIAVMGIGGVHLVGKATESKIIDRIRNRKRDRKYKPFAIMVKNIDKIKEFAEISEYEKELLQSFRRPIILLKKKKKFPLPKNIAPGMPNIGVMLPYTGIHHLLFEYVGNIPLIFTSGNISNIPMAIKPKEVIDHLSTLADAFLLHNRQIYQRCDDSVVRFHIGLPSLNLKPKEKIIRRSRGYVPEYIPLPFKTNIESLIAVGPELNSTATITRKYKIFPTQHIGNINNLETYKFLKEAILHMKNLLQIKDEEIKIITHDMHPLFYSTKLAFELKKLFQHKDHKNNEIILVPIQHHFAHAASLMVDAKIPLKTPAVIATLDGVGFGLDGNVWGGEVIKGTYADFSRIFHLSYIPMIGGDRCVDYPPRMLIGFLLKIFNIEKVKKLAKSLQIIKNLEYGLNEFNIMIDQFKRGENIAYSSSCGRLLDSIATLLGICHLKTYRGEPAMRLEGIAMEGDPYSFDFYSEIISDITSENFNNIIPHEKIILKIIEIIQSKNYLIKDLKKIDLYTIPKKLKADIAASALYAIGKIFANATLKIAIKERIKYIGLSGGVAYNELISNTFYSEIKAKILNNKKLGDNFEIKIIQHQNIPPGDAGISIGQAAIAIAQFEIKHQ
ncbi:MAG: carbamoyltransferase HypF [Promethearchaeota archaeon]